MRPDKVDLIVKRKKGDLGVKDEIKQENPEGRLKKQKIDIHEKPIVDLSECGKKQTSVICFTGMTNVQNKPLLREDEIKTEEGTVILTALERKQNMLRENQKRILMYKQQNGIERFSNMTTMMRESSLYPPHRETNFRFGIKENQKFSQRDLCTTKIEEEPPQHPITFPYPSSYPTPSPQSTSSPHPTPTPPLHPTPPPHPNYSDRYSNLTPPYSMQKPYLSNPTPPYDNASPHYPITISPLSHPYPAYPITDSPLSNPSPYPDSQPVDIPTPHSSSSTYLTTPSPGPSPNSPPIHPDIMGIVNMTPLIQPKQFTFDNFLCAYSFKCGSTGKVQNTHDPNVMQIEELDDEEDGFDFCPEEKTWVPIKKRNRMTNYDVFPEKRHLDRKIVPVMAFTFEETNKIGQMLHAQSLLVSYESDHAHKCINPTLLQQQEVDRVEAVAKGAKIIINEDYLQFRHKLSKEVFMKESCMFFHEFKKLPRHIRDILFEATYPSTIGLFFAYLHACRGAKNLMQQENWSSERDKNFRIQNIPDVVNCRSLNLEDFEIMTSPWAVNEEDEIKFERTIKTVGDIISGDFSISVLYFQMVLCTPHPGSILCRNIQDHPAVHAVQLEINELMYRYLKSQQGYNEAIAANSLRSLQHLVHQVHECAHIFWKKRLRTSFDTKQSSDICIDELYSHVWDNPLITQDTF